MRKWHLRELKTQQVRDKLKPKPSSLLATPKLPSFCLLSLTSLLYNLPLSLLTLFSLHTKPGQRHSIDFNNLLTDHNETCLI